MHRRFFFVFFLILYAEVSLATDAAWNCEKVAGKEWACSAEPELKTQEKPVDMPVETGQQSKRPTPAPVPLAVPVPKKIKPVYIQPPKTVAKRQGWTCDPNDEDETWSCQLIGPDPKGKEHVMGQDDYASGLFPAAFDYQEEQIFQTLHSQLKFDPWENCIASYPRSQYHSPAKDIRNTAPMEVTADYSEVFDKEVTSFFGNVEMNRADQKVLSDSASYDTVSESMDAQGHVYYNENELSLYSDTALLNLSTDEARLRNALFIAPVSAIRGRADVVYRDSKVLSRYKVAAFTSCPPGNQDWVIHASRLKMNKRTGKGAAKHAWLEFKGLPVMYTPYISFPLDDRRISGFLTPSVGSSDEGGFDTTIPYYWNIAPNYDLTFWPRYLSKRGVMFGGQFRYLTKILKGSLGLEVMPYDSLREEPRYTAKFKNEARFTPHLSSSMDLNYISDDQYFDELNNALGLSNDRHIRSQMDLRYQNEGISLVTRAEAYQTIDKDISASSRPYQKLPQVNLNLDHSFEQWPLDLAMENEYINFYREGRVRGHRINIKPSVMVPIETAGSFIKPKVSLQYTQYFLQDQLAGKPNNISRTLPVLSVDSGLFFEKAFELAGSKYLHTIEPRLFYLYIPETQQSDIPVFDSSLYDFSYSSLFRENRFSSVDRVQDANQITVAMTSRLLDSENGQERLRLSVGEIFYFRDRTVTLSGAPETNRLSNLVAELSGQLTDNWSFSSGLQWNPDVNKVTRGNAELRYRNKAEQIINLGYRYRRDDPNAVASIIQSDASFRWPLYDHWYGVGRWQYSLKFNQTKESFLGLEKESCCWRFRLIWRRFANTLSDSSDSVMDEGFFVQLELKGFTSFGDKVDDFLEMNLNGYQKVGK